MQSRCNLQALIPDLARRSSRLLGLNPHPHPRPPAALLPRQCPSASLQLSIRADDTVQAAIHLSDGTIDCQLAHALHRVQPALTAAKLRQRMWARAAAAKRRWPRAVHAAHLRMQVTIPCPALSRAMQVGAAAAAAAATARQARRGRRAELVQGVTAMHEQLHKEWLEARCAVLEADSLRGLTTRACGRPMPVLKSIFSRSGQSLPDVCGMPRHCADGTAAACSRHCLHLAALVPKPGSGLRRSVWLHCAPMTWKPTSGSSPERAAPSWTNSWVRPMPA